MSRAVWLPDVFRDAGLPVRVEAGFDTRGRPTLTPQWIVEHHTASSRNGGNHPALGICRDGRTGVPGPLCNWLTARDGTIICVASGTANHAGAGRYPDGRTGNSLSYGDEAENDGVGEPWPGVQLENIARADAALCRYHGWTEDQVIGHKEFTTRKIDPTYDMDVHRARVGQLLTPSPLPIPTPAVTGEPEGDNTMRFFISDPAYGLRLVTTDGKIIIDRGAVLTDVRPGDQHVAMTPAEYNDLFSRYELRIAR